jgi:hypothetical protein
MWIKPYVTWMDALDFMSVRTLRTRYQEAELKGSAVLNGELPNVSLAIPQTALSIPLRLVIAVLPIGLLLASISRITAMREAISGAVLTCGTRPADTDVRVLYLYRWITGPSLKIFQRYTRYCWLGILVIGPYLSWIYVLDVLNADTVFIGSFEISKVLVLLCYLLLVVGLEGYFFFKAYATLCKVLTSPCPKDATPK